MPFANALVSIGEIELMSITSFPLESPEATPLSEKSTSFTCGVSGSIRMTISAAFVTSAGVSSTFNPPSVSSFTGAFRCFDVTSECPAFWRLSAIGVPMMPSPIKPIVVM